MRISTYSSVNAVVPSAPGLQPPRTVPGYLLTAVFLVGIYTNIHLYLGGVVLVPVVIAGAAGFLLLIKNSRSLNLSHLIALLALVAIAYTSLLVKGADEYLAERVKGLLQLSYSIVFAYSFFLELSKWEKKKVRRLFYCVTALLLLGCALENYGPVKQISDEFRASVFPTNLYEAPERDYSIFGMERPKLFSAEPSYVGIFILFSLSTWLALSKPSAMLYLHAVALLAAAIYLTGSPFLLLFLAPILPLTVIFLFEGGLVRFLINLSPGRLLIYSFVLVLLVMAVGTAVSTVLAPRIDTILAGGGSSIIRLVAPPLITFDVLAEHPLWGSGIGAKEMFADTVHYWLIQVFGLSYLDGNGSISNLVTNAFWLHWLYLGLLGGTFMIIALRIMMQVLGAKHGGYIFLMTCIFANTMGAYVGLKFWSIIFVFILCSTFQAREDSGYPDSFVDNK